ncbi:antitoxin [Streptomyces sp. NPDC002889]|uniref:antitoxin n=1 Tax=Streptomyces sp. NPDC002889 TaxID=3364669 RepID=UPI0036A709FF
MSMMDKIRSMLKGHESEADKGVERAGDTIDDRTQGKHRRQVDTGQEKLKDQYGSQGRQEPPQP